MPASAIRNVFILVAVGFCIVITAKIVLRRPSHQSVSSHSYSSSTGSDNRNSPEDSSDTKGQQAEASGAVLHLHVQKVMDTEGTGKLACTYLIPDGWTAQDRIQWIPNDYLTPIMGTSTVRNGDGSQQIETMSGLEVSFARGPGASSGVEPPTNVSAFLLKSWKKDHSGIPCEVLAEQDTPIDLPNGGYIQGGHMFASRGMFKIRWKNHGSLITTKTQARMDGFRTDSMQTGFGVAYEGGWMISNLYQVSAPADQLPDAMKVAGIVLTSVRMDPHFFNTVSQARELIQQNFHNMETRIHETSVLISRTNDEMIANIDQSMAQGQQVQQHELTGFDDYIRGVDKYNDPDGTVDLPSGYNHAFSDGNGKYIVTDEHGYDPNVNGPGGTWTELEKRQ